MARRWSLILPIGLSAVFLFVIWVILLSSQTSYWQKNFSIPSDLDLMHPEVVLVTVDCFETVEEYTCGQTDEQYELVKSMYQDLVKGCADCDTIVSGISENRPSRIALIDVGRMREMGAVDLCFSGKRLNDMPSWQDEWLHAATFSVGTAISEGGYSYIVSTKWLMQKRKTRELAIVIDPGGKGIVDANGDALEMYFPCNEASQKNLLNLLRTFGAIF